MNSLTALNLSKRYGHRVALNDVSIEVKQGEIVGLLGPNGAGKTTCFYAIAGIVKPDRGQIVMNGTPISKLPIHLRAQHGLSYLPQEKSVFTDLNVLENVLAVIEIHSKKSAEYNRKHALKILSDIGVAHLAEENVNTLSGGERRRVEIARLLAITPSFVLLDEPFAAIAPIAVKELQEIIFSLCDKGMGIIITDHNVRETLAICHRAYILDQGSVLVSGKPRDIIDNPMAKTRYLGNEFIEPINLLH